MNETGRLGHYGPSCSQSLAQVKIRAASRFLPPPLASLPTLHLHPPPPGLPSPASTPPPPRRAGLESPLQVAGRTADRPSTSSDNKLALSPPSPSPPPAVAYPADAETLALRLIHGLQERPPTSTAFKNAAAHGGICGGGGYDRRSMVVEVLIGALWWRIADVVEEIKDEKIKQSSLSRQRGFVHLFCKRGLVSMTTLSEAYRNDPITDHHITPLDFDSIDRVPETHLWPHFVEPHNKIRIHDDGQGSLIPVIDLKSPNAKDLIGQACQTWGMFQVINHGVPYELVKRVESESRRLFGLPAHEKRKVLRLAGGATGYGSARISPFFDKCMWHEGFTIMGSCVDDAKVLWPHGSQRFSDTMDAYQKEIKQLTHNLLLLIMETLDVTQEEINWATSNHDSQGALQLNSYPSCPNPNQAVGLAPHTDSLLLTLLDQCGISGLEIFVEGLGWRQVHPVEGAFVVNVGDLLHIFSNAKFPVLSHRAMVNQSKHRISVAYFHGPPVESRVSPLIKSEKPCFKSLLVKEYLSLKNKHFSKALLLIRT
ncbi:hypothetical protein R6Q59_027502 [Mikania micrantha]